jgi:hypothetical protein
VPAPRRVRSEQRTAEACNDVTLPPLPELPPLSVLPSAEPATKRGFGSGAGRAKGQKDRVSVALKEAILRAAEEAGDVMADAAADKGEERAGGLEGYLLGVALSDPKTFCGLLGKVLPMQITGGDGKSLEVTFKTVYEEAPKSPPAPAPHDGN